MSTNEKDGISATPSSGSSCQATNHTGDQDAKVEEGIQVAFRMRPLNQNERSHRRVWKVLPKFSSVTQTTTEGQPLPERISGRTFFTFDKTFGEDCTTQQVYDSVARGIVSSVCAGLNGTIFAYGQTSSGKTYTMQGSGTIEEGNTNTGGGIVHMAAQDIFRHIRSQAERIFLVRASFLEIYNEEVRDLLASSSDNRAISIREDPRRGVFVQSKEEIVTDYASLLSVLFQGEKSRAFAATAMNERSSRSHTIFRVTIESREKAPKSPENSNGDDDEENADISGCNGAVLVSTLNLVDLAGSESVRHTGATGDRQKEGGMINTSLLTLSRVIVALGSSNQSHINFRDSKLTRLLQPSLSGNARMAVICCATSSELYLEETRSTLAFASRAKLVKTRAQVNEVLDDRSIIRRLQLELAEAKRTVVGVDQLRESEKTAAVAVSVAREAKERLKALYKKILNRDNSLLTENKPFNQNIASRKRRVSDGMISRSGSSPEKAAADNKQPHTALRHSKRMRQPFAERISPSKERDLMRQALESKSQIAKANAHRLDQASLVISQQEAELMKMKTVLDASEAERIDACARSETLLMQQSEINNKLELTQNMVVQKELEIEQKSRKIDELVEEIGIQEAKANDLFEEKLESQALVEALRTESASRKDQIDTLLSEFKQLKQKLIDQANLLELEANHRKQIEVNFVEVNTANDTLSEELAKIKGELAESLDQLKHSNNLLHEANTQIEKVKAEKIEMCETLVNERTRLEQLIQVEQKEVMTLKNDLKRRGQEENASEEKLQEASLRIEEFDHENIKLKDELALMKLELSNSAEQWKTRLETSVQDAQEKINVLTNEIERVNQEKKVDEEKLQEASLRIDELDRTRLELSDALGLKISELSNYVEQNKYTSNLLREGDFRIKELETEKLKIQQALTDAKKELEASINEHKEQMIALSRELEGAVKEKDAEQQKLRDAFVRIDELQCDNLESSKELILAKAELASGTEQRMHNSNKLQEAISKIEEIEDEKDEILQSLTAANDKNTILETSLHEAQNKIAVLANEVEHAMQEKTATERKLEDVSMRREELDRNKRGLIEELALKNSELTNTVTQYKHTSNLLDEANCRINELETEKRQIADDLADLKGHNQEQITALTNELERARKENEVNQQKLKDALGSIEELDFEKLELNKALTMLRAELAESAEQQTFTSNELLEVIARITELEREKVEILQSLTTVNDSKTFLETNLQHAQDKITTLINDIERGSLEQEACDRKLLEASVRIEELNCHKRDLHEELDLTNRELTDTMGKHQHTANLLREASARIKELEAENHDKVDTITAITSSNILLETSVQTMQEQVLTLKNELESADQQRKVDNQKLQEASLKIEELERECKLTSEKIDGLTKQLTDACSYQKEASLKIQDLERERLLTLEKIDDLNKQLTEAISCRKDAEIQIESHKQSLELAEQTILSLEAKCELVHTEVTSAKALLARTQEDNDTYKVSCELEIERLQTLIVTLEREKSAVDILCASNATEIDNLQSMLKSSTNQLTKLEESYQNLKMINEQEISKANRIAKEKDDLVEKMHSFEASLASFSEKLAEVEGERDRLTLAWDETRIGKDETVQSTLAMNDVVAQITEQKEKAEMMLCSQELENVKAMQSITKLSEEVTSYKRSLESVKETLQHEQQAFIKRESLLILERDSFMEQLKSSNEAILVYKLTESAVKARLQATETKLATLMEEKVILEHKVSEKLKEIITLQNDLHNSEDALETTKSGLCLRIAELDAELKSKNDLHSQSLSMFEIEKKTLTNELASEKEVCQQIKLQLNDLKNVNKDSELKLKDAQDCIASLKCVEQKLKLLEEENFELKHLLAESNRSISEARDKAIAAESIIQEQMQMIQDSHQKISSLEEQIANGANEDRNLAENRKKYEDLQNKLQSEVLQLRQTEENLKIQMAEEQRELIREAEEAMQKLTDQCNFLQESLQQLQSEAHATTQLKQELEEENMRYMQQVTRLENQVSTFESDINRLRRNASRQDSEKDAEIANSKRLIQKMKVERVEATSRIGEYENQIQLLLKEKQHLSRELEAAHDMATKVDIPGLESENCRILQELLELKEDFDKLRREDEKKQNELEKLTKQLKEKDQRIEKLDKVKLTKAQIKQLQKLKADYASCQTQLEQAQSMLAKFTSENSTNESNTSESTRVTELLFDNQALEKKLRKFATHCQRLEDERQQIMQVLRSTKLEEIENEDVSKAIIILCDKIASLEEERASLLKTESKSASASIEMDKLREHNASLRRQVSDYQRKVDKLVRAELEMQDTFAKQQKDLEELRRSAERSKAKSETVENETNRKLRYLEQENLQLMLDLKSSKKELQKAKADMNIVRAQKIDNSEIIHQSSKVLASPDVSNKENMAQQLPKTHRYPLRGNRGRVPGLGESLDSNNDNTEDCKQS